MNRRPAPPAPLLLLRPAQEEGESFPGYLLRLCSVNRIEGIEFLQRLLGVSYVELVMMNPSLFSELIRGEKNVGDINRRQATAKRGLAVNRLGVSTKTRICPKCFKEGRPHAASWDLPLSIACEFHHQCLIDQCPQCKVKISHRRKDAYLCACGLDWRHHEAPDAPSWKDKFEELFAPWRRGEPNLQNSVIEREYYSLLLLTGYLASPSSLQLRLSQRSYGRSMGKLNLNMSVEIEELLKDWPTALQRRIVELHDAAPNPLLRLKKLSENLGLNVLAELTRDAVKQNRENKRKSRKAIPFAERSGEITSAVELAELLEVDRSTAANLIEAGAFNGVQSTKNGNGTYRQIVIPIDESRRIRELHTSTLRLDRAAMRLGCTPLFLNLMTRAGGIPFNRLINESSGWRFKPSDLDKLQKALVSLALPEASADPQSLVGLAKIVPWSHRGHPGRPWVAWWERVTAKVAPLYLLNDRPPGFGALAVDVADLPKLGRRIKKHRGARSIKGSSYGVESSKGL